MTSAAHPLRWVVLAALLVAAAAWALPRLAVPRGASVAASALVCLALLSSAWSVEPRTTFERSVSLGLLFCTCALLAAAARVRPDRVSAVLAGLVGGAVAVGVAGLILLAVDHGRAVEPGSYEAPARFRGFGQDPNTVALLFGVVTPLAVWGLVAGRRRGLSLAALALLAGTIVATGSRGGLVAAAVGSAAVMLAGLRGRRPLALGLAAVAAATALGAGVQSLPKAQSLPPPAPAAAATKPKAKPAPVRQPRYVDAEAAYPLDADVGAPLPGGGQPTITRSFFGTSGRIDAWRGALHDVARRPLVGHGFGTEGDVFVDRYYYFVGGLPENSYIGLALQLGAAGLIALGALVLVLAGAGLRGLQGPRRDLAAACLGVLAAGLVAGLFQSYFYSVGNIAAAALWIPAFLLGTVAAYG